MTIKTVKLQLNLLDSPTFQEVLNKDKKAELSQRWLRDATYVSVHWKLSGVPDYADG